MQPRALTEHSIYIPHEANSSDQQFLASAGGLIHFYRHQGGTKHCRTRWEAPAGAWGRAVPQFQRHPSCFCNIGATLLQERWGSAPAPQEGNLAETQSPLQ